MRLNTIPGIGKTFERDFARIGILDVAQLRGADPDALYASLVQANADEGHRTSRNYLYVIRMAVYFADGGREVVKLKWSAWTDKATKRC
ncbi:MAG: helix-hairpin-helix domain-containing protein [Aestuariivirga sp.]|jgi:hypothetical protein